jgi:hypothetical protein
MNKKDRIKEEIQKTLEQFDQQESLPRDPYFYTRLQAQLDSRRQQRRVFAAVLRPAMLVLLVVANVGTAAWYLNRGSSDINPRQELVELLADDFNVDSNESTIFNLE